MLRNIPQRPATQKIAIEWGGVTGILAWAGGKAAEVKTKGLDGLPMIGEDGIAAVGDPKLSGEGFIGIRHVCSGFCALGGSVEASGVGPRLFAIIGENEPPQPPKTPYISMICGGLLAPFWPVDNSRERPIAAFACSLPSCRYQRSRVPSRRTGASCGLR